MELAGKSNRQEQELRARATHLPDPEVIAGDLKTPD